MCPMLGDFLWKWKMRHGTFPIQIVPGGWQQNFKVESFNMYNLKIDRKDRMSGQLFFFLPTELYGVQVRISTPCGLFAQGKHKHFLRPQHESKYKSPMSPIRGLEKLIACRLFSMDSRKILLGSLPFLPPPSSPWVTCCHAEMWENEYANRQSPDPT